MKNACHEGYMDGLRGLDPDPNFVNWTEYETGWLHGSQDHDEGKPVVDVLDDPPFKKGDRVRVPKGTLVWSTNPKTSGKNPTGKSYSVTLHGCYSGLPARIDPGTGDFVPPRAGEAVWVGTGGYWVYSSNLDLQSESKEG